MLNYQSENIRGLRTEPGLGGKAFHENGRGGGGLRVVESPNAKILDENYFCSNFDDFFFAFVPVHSMEFSFMIFPIKFLLIKTIEKG